MRELFRYRGGASLIKNCNDANNQRNFISREYYIEKILYRDLFSSIVPKNKERNFGEFFAFSIQCPILENSAFRFASWFRSYRLPRRYLSRTNAHVSFTLDAMRLLSSRRFLALIFTRNVLPPAPSQAIVRSVLSARWIQIVLRQQGYNPVDIKLAILDFAKFALLDREGPYVFLRWQIQMAYYICCAFLSLVY